MSAPPRRARPPPRLAFAASAHSDRAPPALRSAALRRPDGASDPEAQAALAGSVALAIQHVLSWAAPQDAAAPSIAALSKATCAARWPGELQARWLLLRHRGHAHKALCAAAAAGLLGACRALLEQGPALARAAGPPPWPDQEQSAALVAAARAGQAAACQLLLAWPTRPARADAQVAAAFGSCGEGRRRNRSFTMEVLL